MLTICIYTEPITKSHIMARSSQECLLFQYFQRFRRHLCIIWFPKWLRPCLTPSPPSTTKYILDPPLCNTTICRFQVSSKFLILCTTIRRTSTSPSTAGDRRSDSLVNSFLSWKFSFPHTAVWRHCGRVGTAVCRILPTSGLKSWWWWWWWCHRSLGNEDLCSA